MFSGGGGGGGGGGGVGGGAKQTSRQDPFVITHPYVSELMA